MGGGGLDGSGSVEVQHQRVRFAVLSEVPDSRDRLSEVGFFFLFFPVSSTGELSSHRRLPLIADMWWEKKEVYSCQFEGLWAVLLQHKQIIITDKNSDTALGVSAGVSRSAAPRGVC